jgi:hypothetical protein
MDFKSYIRKPFDLEAVEITEENFDEIADLIGREVRTLNDGTRCIVVDQKVIPTVKRVFVGWFLTRVGDNYRCYAPNIFDDQFAVKNPSEIAHNVFDASTSAVGE